MSAVLCWHSCETEGSYSRAPWSQWWPQNPSQHTHVARHLTWLLIALYPTLPGTILHSNGHAAAQWAMRLTSSWSHVNYLPPAQPSSHQQPPEAECSASQTSPTVAALQSLLHVARDCRHVETRVKRAKPAQRYAPVNPADCLFDGARHSTA